VVPCFSPDPQRKHFLFQTETRKTESILGDISTVYIYTYTIYYNIIFLYRPLNVQVSKKLARLSHNHNMSNIVGPDNILTRLSSLHGPSFRSRGKGAASLWLNMTEGQTESESKNMNIILYMRIINTII